MIDQCLWETVLLLIMTNRFLSLSIVFFLFCGALSWKCRELICKPIRQWNTQPRSYFRR